MDPLLFATYLDDHLDVNTWVSDTAAHTEYLDVLIDGDPYSIVVEFDPEAAESFGVMWTIADLDNAEILGSGNVTDPAAALVAIRDAV